MSTGLLHRVRLADSAPSDGSRRAAPRGLRIAAAPTDPGGTRAHGTQSSPGRSATSPSSATAGRARRPSSRRCSSRRARSTGSGRSRPARPSPTRTRTSRSASSRSRSRSPTRAGRAARSTSSTARATRPSRARRAARSASSRARSSSSRGVMGFEVGTARVKKLAEELGLARVLVVNMLDRERADFFRTLGQIQEQFSSRCVAVHIPIGAEHELEGIVDVLHMCAYMSPDGQKEGDPVAIPDAMHGARAGVPREAPRRGRADRRGADGALPRGRGARPARGRGRAQARRHARRDLPGRLLRSRRRTSARMRSSTCSSRACRRRPSAGAPFDVDGASTAAFVFKTIADPFAGKINLFRVLKGAGHDRDDAARPSRARRRSGWARCSQLQGKTTHAGEGVRRGRPRRRREAQGRPDRRPPDRPRGRGRAAARSASPSR